MTGIEPAWPAWKAGALPLSYTRISPKRLEQVYWVLTLLAGLAMLSTTGLLRPTTKGLRITLSSANSGRVGFAAHHLAWMHGFVAL